MGDRIARVTARFIPDQFDDPVDKIEVCVRRISFIISAGCPRGIPNTEEPVERTRALGRVFRVAARRL